MNSQPSHNAVEADESRPVLIWHPDTDASEVKGSVADAAASLKVSSEAVTAAIASGDLVGGHFVDWDAPDR